MSDSLLMEHIGVDKIPPLDMDSFINMLWDQDMDMGVDRQFYDPVFREQELKKQEANQSRLIELKKKQAKKEMQYYTIDQETGERIPKPSTGPYQAPAEVTEDTDLSKELAELSEITDLDYLFNETPQAEPAQMFNTSPAMQPQQNIYNDYNMIIQTADQPNPASDVDMWPTEITMLPGPSDSPGFEADMFSSDIWGAEKSPNTSSAAGFYGAFSDNVEVTPQYHTYVEPDTQNGRFQSTVSPYFNSNTSDSGVSLQDNFLDSFGTDNSTCTFSSQTYNEDVKPQFLFPHDLTTGPPQKNDSGSSAGSSSRHSDSENGDNSGLSNSEQERERRNACRDELRCKELGIPFSVDVITNFPVEEFNSLLRQHRLTEEQLTLVKDIRRRGKNKVAAQNCRKKKMNELTGLEIEINDLKRKRSELVRDKDDLKRSKLHLRKQLDQTYAEVFNSIRDHLGRPYDPRFYTLHISDDGDARVIPNKVSTYALLNYQTA